ncbi:MAG: hypothetical protein E7618_00970 [Ruminococcaceae bacterium]|nr:hypothetical protein [Oscillospiraceae bacterium]
MSELFDNGWALNKGYEYQTEVEADTITDLIRDYLIHEGGMTINLKQIVNDSDEKKIQKNVFLPDLKSITMT